MVLRRTARLRGGISRSKTPAGMPRGVGALRRVMKPTPACWIGSLVRQHGKHALFEICISQEICVYCPVRVTVQFRDYRKRARLKNRLTSVSYACSALRRPGTIDRLCGIFPLSFTFIMFHSSAIEEHEGK